MGLIGIFTLGYDTLLVIVFVPWTFVGIIVPSWYSHPFSLIDSWFSLYFIIHIFLVHIISTLYLALLLIDILLDLHLLILLDLFLVLRLIFLRSVIYLLILILSTFFLFAIFVFFIVFFLRGGCIVICIGFSLSQYFFSLFFNKNFIVILVHSYNPIGTMNFNSMHVFEF